MKSLHRATLGSPKGKFAQKTISSIQGKSRGTRFFLISVTIVALFLFFASQLVNNESHASERYDTEKKRQRGDASLRSEREERYATVGKLPPPAVAGLMTRGPGVDPYANVTLATLDAGVANRENLENAVAAEAALLQGSELKMDIAADLSKNEAVVQRALAGDAGRGLTCPKIDLEAFDRELQIPLRHLPRRKKTSVGQKYDRRAHNCAGDGIWNRVTIKDHHDILQNIVRLARIRPGAFVFDWGSGCGHQLNFLTKEYGVTGVGIDVSTKTVAYAVANTSKKNMHCVADGSKLEWIPTGHFDTAYSFGSIYHVYNRSKFCSILRQMVRIVKPGGTVYNGWTENAEFRRNHVGMCLSDLPVKFTIFEEATEFKNVKIFPLKAGQTTPNTYSLVITKLKGYDASEFDSLSRYTYENLPLICGVHQCEAKPGVVPFSGGSGINAVVGPATPSIGFRNEETEHKNVTDGQIWSFDNWPTCPPYDSRMEDDLQIPIEHLPRKRKTSVGQKYDRRAHNCATSGVWHKVSISDHKAILDVIGRTIEAKKGEIVFDWGCGCGHQLEFMFERFGTRGLGIDVSNLTIAYAINSTTPANRYCVADGTRLDWIPSNFFDKAFSFGSVYHVYNKRKFCSVLRQMVRIVKPGGIVYNGWTEDSEFHRDEVVKCVNTNDDSWMSAKDRSYHASSTKSSGRADIIDVDPDSPGNRDSSEPINGTDLSTTFPHASAVREASVLANMSSQSAPLSVGEVDSQPLSIERITPILGALKIDGSFSDGELSASPIKKPERRNVDRSLLQYDTGGNLFDHLVTILPEKDLFSSVVVFPLKSKRQTRSTYSVLIRKSRR